MQLLQAEVLRDQGSQSKNSCIPSLSAADHLQLQHEAAAEQVRALPCCGLAAARSRSARPASGCIPISMPPTPTPPPPPPLLL
jgi:hypothetical protein